jgi:hypothetical protein
MTRKDYVLLAEALASVRPSVHDTRQSDVHMRDCRAVAEALARENERFDRARFLKACGIE